MTYYKFLNGRESPLVPGCRYRLKAWQPPVEGPLVPCENGYHMLTASQVAGEYIARDLFVAEIRGDTVEDEGKVVARECRIIEHLRGWNERTQRLFAADCAERVAHLWERRYPGDDRVRLAIQAARDFAHGEIGEADLWAAGAAACAAADDADWAAGDVAWVAGDTAWATGDTVWATAGAAARTAAARTDDAAAEREWQSGRLLDYGARRLA